MTINSSLCLETLSEQRGAWVRTFNGSMFCFAHGKVMRSYSFLPLGGCRLSPLEVAKLASISFARDVCTGVLGKLLGGHVYSFNVPSSEKLVESRIFPAHPVAWVNT